MKSTSERPYHEEERTLQHKLLNYTTAASLALATSLAIPVRPAEAAYACVTPSHSSGVDYSFDFDGDMDPEFMISFSSSTLAVRAMGTASWNDDTGVAVIATSASVNPYASALNSGVLISAGKNFQRLYTKGSLLGFIKFMIESSSGPWSNAGQKYLGLKFKQSTGEIFYGWARVTVNSTDGSDFTVNKYCYNTTANGSIYAGQSPTAINLSDFEASSASPWKLSALGAALMTSIAGLWVWVRKRLLSPDPGRDRITLDINR